LGDGDYDRKLTYWNKLTAASGRNSELMDNVTGEIAASDAVLV
jgi:hypothetical protein